MLNASDAAPSGVNPDAATPTVRLACGVEPGNRSAWAHRWPPNTVIALTRSVARIDLRIACGEGGLGCSGIRVIRSLKSTTCIGRFTASRLHGFTQDVRCTTFVPLSVQRHLGKGRSPAPFHPPGGALRHLGQAYQSDPRCQGLKGATHPRNVWPLHHHQREPPSSTETPMGKGRLRSPPAPLSATCGNSFADRVTSPAIKVSPMGTIPVTRRRARGHLHWASCSGLPSCEEHPLHRLLQQDDGQATPLDL